MSEFEFIKMNGLGNDFVIIDQRSNELDHSSTEVQHICNRDKGIGCDQLIYIRNSEISDIPLLKFYNSDGGEISACGNGTRCVANYLMEQDNKKEIEIMTNERKIYCQAKSNSIVSVDMGEPKFSWNEIPLSQKMNTQEILIDFLEKDYGLGFCVNVGNPHIIYFVDECTRIDIKELGSRVENYKLFPERINVTFAQILDKKNIKVNVWERGAGLTKACGTAACATAVAASKKRLVGENSIIHFKGGNLQIDYKDEIFMTGPVSDIKKIYLKI